MVQACPLSQTWIEVKLVDEDGNPVRDQKYKIVLPDGSIRKEASTAKARSGLTNCTGQRPSHLPGP